MWSYYGGKEKCLIPPRWPEILENGIIYSTNEACFSTATDFMSFHLVHTPTLSRDSAIAVFTIVVPLFRNENLFRRATAHLTIDLGNQEGFFIEKTVHNAIIIRLE